MSNPILRCDHAGAPRRRPTLRRLGLAVAAVMVAALPSVGLPAATDLSSVPLPTYTVGSTVDIKPNIFMVLDDSGSMDWDYLPDWANDRPANVSSMASGNGGDTWTSTGPHTPDIPQYLFFNSQFNGVAYNPSILYSPPVLFKSDGTKDTATYPSMDGTTAARGRNTSLAANPNWGNVLNDGYKVQSSSTSVSSLIDNRNAYFYTAVPGEWCNSPALDTCQTTAGGKFLYPAPLRWCSDQKLTTCRGLQSSTYKYPRFPAPRLATLKVTSIQTNVGGGNVSGITVDSKQIMSGTASVGSSDPVGLAAAIASKINDCRYALSGNCTIPGYWAEVSETDSQSINIFAPGIPPSSPSLAKTTSVSVTFSDFAPTPVPVGNYFATGQNRSTGAVPGENIRTVLTSTTTSYAYPGANTKASSRTDCTGTTCTYNEEMTNYANWWAYYRTRMQMMKTAASAAFGKLDTDADNLALRSRYRVGYLTINNNTTTDFVNIAEFNPAQKVIWYSQLFKAKPNQNTPLRSALAIAGQLYGGKMNTNSFRGSTVTDPLQFSCQKNYTILSTDGYWNENSNAPNNGWGSKLDGSTMVGNQDGGLARPYNDGASVQNQARTSKLQTRVETQVATKGTLQKQLTQLQSQTFKLQSQTSQLQQITQQLQTQTNPLQTRTNPLTKSTNQLQTKVNQAQFNVTRAVQTDSILQKQPMKLQARSSSNGGTSFSGWNDVASNGTCSWSVSGKNGSNVVQCQWATNGAATTITSGNTCTVDTHVGSPSTTYTPARWNDCVYTAQTAVTLSATASCTVVAPSAGPTTFSVRTATACSYAAAADGFQNTASCTKVAQATSGTNYPPAVDCKLLGYPVAWTDVPAGTSCTKVTAVNGPTYSTGVDCQYAGWTSAQTLTVGSTCTDVAISTGPTTFTGNGSQCANSGWSGWTNTNNASCTKVPVTAAPNWVYGVDCQYAGFGGLTNVATGGTCNFVAQSAGPSYPGNAVTCQYAAGVTTQPASSCTPATASTGPAYSVVVATSCTYVVTAAWANAASCNKVPQSTGSTLTVGTATDCRYNMTQDWTGVQTCNAVNQSTGTSFTVADATSCRSQVTQVYADTTSCVPSSSTNGSGVTTQCQYNFAASAPTATCAPAYAAGNFGNVTVYDACGTTSNNTWTNATSCTITAPDATGKFSNCRYDAWTAWSNVGSCTAASQSLGPTSFTVGTATDCQTIAGTGGTTDTLADVAAYYYNTDLRTTTPATTADRTGTCTSASGGDLCVDNVAPNGRDVARIQHMTTHTLGLGATGMMVFSPYQNDLAGTRTYTPDYWGQVSGDFYDVSNGSLASPSTGICPWLGNGTKCTWATPSNDSPANIDDLWHAAVNGHGTYFSASDPTSLANSLTNVLNQIVNTPRPGTAAAAASSNPNITSSDNYVFSSSYRSIDWYGELIMQQFNLDGTLTAQQWSAMRLMDCAMTPWQAGRSYNVGDVYRQGTDCYFVTKAYSSDPAFANPGTDGNNTAKLISGPVTRRIFTVASGSLVDFSYGNLTTTQQGYFSAPYITAGSASGGLSQFCSSAAGCLSSAQQTAAAGSPLVEFLKGDRSNEGTYFRTRSHILGDIVSSEARYVKVPLLNYLDAGYSDFQTAMANRPATVYVGGNDGMLHAFNALTGQERWGFIPPAVLPNLYHLADASYNNQHRYFVDGTPEVGDICPTAPTTTCSGTQWKTVLVGGLNQGGKSFYAMDVTDPLNPRYMWEFSDTNLGYSYSNPRITKLANGTWVVIVASGYNNADGQGHLYVLNASTGALISDINDGVGTAALPSGLTRLAARSTTAASNNTVEQVYGGDLYGNVWRFDVNDRIGTPGVDAQLLVSLKDPSGNPQPVTAKPTVATVPGSSLPLVIVGTGRYLGVSDLTDTSTYSVYAIKDNLNTTTLTSPRVSGSNFVQQTLTETNCPNDAPAATCTSGQTIRSASSNVVDWSVRNGWYLDFPVGGERAVTDASLALGTLVFTTIKPQSATAEQIAGCNGADTAINAKSFLYYLDYLSGGAVDGTKNVVGEELCTCIATRPSVVKTASGNIEGIIRTSGGGTGSATTGTNTDPNGQNTDGGVVGGACENTIAGCSTDMGQTQRQDLPYKNAGGAARRISYRELNGE